MFYVYGVAGRVASASPEWSGRVPPAAAVARSRAPDAIGPETGDGVQDGSQDPGRRLPAALRSAYGGESGAGHPRSVRRCSDLMVPVSCTVPLTARVCVVWERLWQQRIDHAWVTDRRGQLCGLLLRQDFDAASDFGRFNLPEAATPGLLHSEALRVGRHCGEHWARWLELPLQELMRSPLPALLPHTPLRQAASLLLQSQLPVLPVVDDGGGLVGELGVAQLLAAIATDPPLDLWT